jgi:hypothetical protein
MQCKTRRQKSEFPGIIGDKCDPKSPALASRVKAITAGSKPGKDQPILKCVIGTSWLLPADSVFLLEAFCTRDD